MVKSYSLFYEFWDNLRWLNERFGYVFYEGDYVRVISSDFPKNLEGMILNARLILEKNPKNVVAQGGIEFTKKLLEDAKIIGYPIHLSQQALSALYH